MTPGSLLAGLLRSYVRRMVSLLDQLKLVDPSEALNECVRYSIQEEPVDGTDSSGR